MSPSFNTCQICDETMINDYIYWLLDDDYVCDICLKSFGVDKIKHVNELDNYDQDTYEEGEDEIVQSMDKETYLKIKWTIKDILKKWLESDITIPAWI